MKKLLLLAAVAFAAGCPPPPNYLDGSVKDAHPLDFDTVELRFENAKSFHLSYTKALNPDDASAGVDIITEVLFNPPTGGVKKEKEINLLDATVQGAVQRVTAANDPFPDTMKTGEVTFHSDATVGKQVTGEFAVTFDNGETLFGAFQTKLTAVSF